MTGELKGCMGNGEDLAGDATAIADAEYIAVQ